MQAPSDAKPKKYEAIDQKEQMQKGVPGATRDVNSSYAAGIFACEIPSTKYSCLKKKLIFFRMSKNQAQAKHSTNNIQ